MNKYNAIYQGTDCRGIRLLENRLRQNWYKKIWHYEFHFTFIKVLVQGSREGDNLYVFSTL
jgi:hypothetical protein